MVLDELAVDVARLADLADQLLSLGSAGAHDGSTADVALVVGGAVDRRRLAHPDEQVEVRVPSGGRLSAPIAPLALERVVDNLVQNAATHGRPPVRVAVDRPGSGWVRIAVTDGGAGMGAELLAEATQRFTRSAEARSSPGAGLGLALVEGLVTGAGGELRLCSRGRHVSHGVAAPVDCDHPGATTVTVLLPEDRTG